MKIKVSSNVRKRNVGAYRALTSGSEIIKLGRV